MASSPTEIAPPVAPVTPVSTAARLTFLICAASTYIVTLDLSIVNVAFPEIQKAFEGSTRAQLSWIVTAYNIFYAGLLVVAGKTADRVGRKQMFLLGTAVFGAGSILAGAAPTLNALIAGRVVQGVGGAIAAPAALGLLLGAFPPQRRTAVMAGFGSIGALGVASGPSLGAALITATDWRAAFLVNLPVCIAVYALGRRILVEMPRQPSEHTPDYAGAAMITVALGSLALGLSQSERWGLRDPRTLASIGLAIVLAPAFVTRQRRHAEPVLDLGLFRSRSFSVANCSTVLFSAAFAAYGLNNVLFLRTVWGMSVLKAGLVTAVGPLTVAMLAPFTGRIAARFGFRPPLLAGPVILASAVLTYRFALDADANLMLWILMGVIGGVGVACIIPVNSAAAVSELPPLRFGIGGAVTNTARQIGSVIGVAGLVALLGEPSSPAGAIASHRRGWVFIAVVALISGAISVMQPSRARHADTGH
jgi:EmrB/QacA subfamily drug resistance transporter